MLIVALVFAWTLTITGLYLVGRRLATRRRSRERVLEPDEKETAPVESVSPDALGFLARWLFRAGYRSPDAVTFFVAALAVMTLLGALAAYALYASGLVRQAAQAVVQIPGGVGDILLPLVYLTPWIWLALLGSSPILMVRAARRKRVAQVEQDLPITLELLATMSEAGLGFDAALERVLRSQPADRPLAQEFRTFQMDILAGRPRIQSLRRLGWRVAVMSLTIFISALVQTEQVGAGVADVLRRQADDLRNRRREQALTVAAAMPVKLLFPLVICFLPGILIATLGPTFFQIFQFLDGIFRSRGL